MIKSLAHTETLYGNQHLTINAADLTAICGYYEIMVMTKDGEEIASRRCDTEEKALLIYKQLEQRYSNVFVASADPASLEYYNYCKVDKALNQLKEAREIYPEDNWTILTEKQYEEKQRALYIKPPEEITEERYYEMLDVLPPLRWVTRNGVQSFILAEPLDLNYYTQFAKYNDKYYTAVVEYGNPETYLENILTKEA